MPDPLPSSISGVFKQPFPEQLAFFRQKLGNLVPTARWDDMLKSAHDAGFMVAGATKADLLADLAAAVERTVAEGKSIEAFRKDFRAIVERHGWHGWTGEESKRRRAWRTRVIYTTNTATSYAAGRLAQLREGGFTHWVYRHNDAVENPRPQHQAWAGLTLPPQHDFWKTHYPPNGWGCRCYVVGARSDRGARRLGGDPGKPLPENWSAPDPRTGTPPGIGKGWDYMPGDTVTDTVRAMAEKTRHWPYELAKAYMQSVPATARDALAVAYRNLPTVADDTRRYARRILEGRDQGDTPPYRTLGLLTRGEAEKIAEMTGLDGVRLRLYDWAVDASTVRKVRKDHGNDAAERKRGQTGVRTEDYALLPRIIAEADRIEYGGLSDVGRPVVRVVKKIGGLEYWAVFEVRPKRRMLALQTLWIRGRPPTLRP